MCRSRAEGGQRCASDAEKGLAVANGRFEQAMQQWQADARTHPERSAAHSDRVDGLSERMRMAEIEFASTEAGMNTFIAEHRGRHTGKLSMQTAQSSDGERILTAGLSLQRRNGMFAEWAAHRRTASGADPAAVIQDQVLAARVHAATADFDDDAARAYSPPIARRWQQPVGGAAATVASVGRWRPSTPRPIQAETTEGEKVTVGHEPLTVVTVSGGRFDGAVALMDRRNRLVPVSASGQVRLGPVRSRAHTFRSDSDRFDGVITPAVGASFTAAGPSGGGTMSPPADAEPMPPLRSARATQAPSRERATVAV